MARLWDTGAGLGGSAAQAALAGAFEWQTWEWSVEVFNGWSLLLIGDQDLSYHHDVEIRFHGVVYVGLTLHQFIYPVWVEPSAADIATFAGTDSGPQGDQPATLFTWTSPDNPAGTAAIVAAERLEIERGLWMHRGP